MLKYYEQKCFARELGPLELPVLFASALADTNLSSADRRVRMIPE
jgi:hypothetical protein